MNFIVWWTVFRGLDVPRPHSRRYLSDPEADPSRSGSKSLLQKPLNATSVAHVWRQLFSLTKSIDGAAVMHCRLLWKIYFEFRSLYELFLSTFHGALRCSRARALVPSRITSSSIQPSYTAISQIRSSSVREARRDPSAFRAARQREGETDERVSQWRNVKLNWLATHKTARVVWLTLQRWRLHIKEIIRAKNDDAKEDYVLKLRNRYFFKYFFLLIWV